jgi:hypothetical protein
METFIVLAWVLVEVNVSPLEVDGAGLPPQAVSESVIERLRISAIIFFMFSSSLKYLKNFIFSDYSTMAPLAAEVLIR